MKPSARNRPSGSTTRDGCCRICTARYGRYPPIRHVPSYVKNTPVRIGGAGAAVTIVNQTTPTRLNPGAAEPGNPLMANAVGAPFARVRNIEIRRVTIEDVDPRYPILIAGLVDHPIENVIISDVRCSIAAA